MKKKGIFLAILSFVFIFISMAAVYASFHLNPDSTNTGKTHSGESVFSDVLMSDWFYRDVLFVKENQLMNGTGEHIFSPNEPTTRGMITTILWRLEEEPIEGSIRFSDVPKDAYYHNAIAWAFEKGIVKGYQEDLFRPEDFVTREQLVSIFYRYTAFKGLSASANFDIIKFSDFEQISDYAVEPIKWAAENGIIKGITIDCIDPNGTATRCQVAAILKRMCESILDTKGSEFVEEEDGSKSEKPVDSNHSPGNSEGQKPQMGGGTSAGSENSNDENNSGGQEAIEKSGKIKVETVYGKPGETVKVNLDLENNPGILGMILSLEYDEAAMKLLNVENGDAVSDVLTLTPSKNMQSGMKFVWDGLEIKPEEIKDGILLVLEFEISEDVTIGRRYPISISYNSGDIVDTNLIEVNPKIYQGYLEIEEIGDEKN